METTTIYDQNEARLLELFRRNNQEDKEWVLKIAERGANRGKKQEPRFHVIVGCSTEKAFA